MLNSSQNKMQCILKRKALNYIAFYTVQLFTLGKLKHKLFLWVMSFALNFSLNIGEIVPQQTKFIIQSQACTELGVKITKVTPRSK